MVTAAIATPDIILKLQAPAAGVGEITAALGIAPNLLHINKASGPLEMA